MVQNNFPKMIIVHHSGGTDANPLADSSHHTLEIIREAHKARGFLDPVSGESVGYHWVIQKDGKVRQGRPEVRNGAHTKGHNTDSVGICVTGNFDATLPTDAQVTSLKKLMGEIMKRYNIPASEIYPHRKFASKTCYGNRLSDTWASELMVTQAQLKKNPSIVLGEHDIEAIRRSIANKEVNGLFQYMKKLLA
jgi:N-acetylmuramoyl-L-alanine amidase